MNFKVKLTIFKHFVFPAHQTLGRIRGKFTQLEKIANTCVSQQQQEGMFIKQSRILTGVK